MFWQKPLSEELNISLRMVEHQNKQNKTKRKRNLDAIIMSFIKRKKEKSAATFPFCIAVNTICSHIWGFGRLIKQHNQFYYHTVFWDPELSWWAFDTIFTLFTAAPKCIEYDPIIDYMLPMWKSFCEPVFQLQKKVNIKSWWNSYSHVGSEFE